MNKGMGFPCWRLPKPAGQNLHTTQIADHFKKLAPKSHIHVIPNGIVKKVFLPEHVFYKNEKPDSLVMTGDFSFMPNVDAAIFYTNNIFPLIRKQNPNAIISFTGRNPSPAIMKLADIPGVFVTGFVDDIFKCIAQSSVYVLPLRQGSGIRSKLLDVFPLGKAIVTTSIGAEGCSCKVITD